MPFSAYTGWGLFVPVCLSILYGISANSAINALKSSRKTFLWNRIYMFLSPLLLFTLWGIFNLPLPAVYILAFLEKLLRLVPKRKNRTMELFLINLTHLTSMAFHLILIGTISFFAKVSMNELLQQPFWRILTIGAVLAVNCLSAWLLPRWNIVLDVLRTQSESAEVRPFMMFLWFCNLFLLLDSVLCISKIDWKLLPLFLIGSTVLLEFYLIRFFKHLYTILKEHYLEKEHQHLVEQLEQQNRDAAELRSKSVLDPMTGIYTRRYLIEQMEILLQSHKPFSFVYMDLDHLKQINDKEGHHAGDLYLIRFAKEFGSQLRKTDIFARVGGDEFAVLLPGCVQELAANQMENIRSRMTSEFNPPFLFSYGVSYISGDSPETVEQIFRRADQAMYNDKEIRNS